MNWRLAVALCASACFAGPFELGGMAGYGLYRNGSVAGPSGTATAGATSSVAAGLVVSEDMYEHVSGELRYLYQRGDRFVSQGSATSTMQGQSHAIHYDFLLSPWSREARIRPYVAVGGGLKAFLATGTPPAQPMPGPATLTGRFQLSPLVTAGVGVRYRLANHVDVRADILDYMSLFPKKVFQLETGATHPAILQQLTPTLGITFRL